MTRGIPVSNMEHAQTGELNKSPFTDSLLGDGELAAAVLDGLLDGIVLVSVDGEVAYVNKAFERMLGYEADELVGKSALELPTYRGKKENSNKAAAILKQVIDRGFADPIDMDALTKDGKKIPLSFTASLIRDTGGKPRTFVAVVRDITERKRMEKALRRSEQMSRGMLATAGTGIYLLEEGCFQYVNRLFEEISGYSSDELKDKYSLDYIHQEDRKFVHNKAVEILKGQSSLPYEYRFIRKNGEAVVVLDRLMSIRYDGKRSVLGSLMDISDIRKAEAQIREYADQLETLFNIGLAATRTLDIKELLENVLAKVLDVTGFDAGGIFLFDQQTKKVTLRAYRGVSKVLIKKAERMKFNEGFTGLVARSGKPIVVQDVGLDSRVMKIGIGSEDIRSFAVVPIMSKEQVRGVISIGSRTTQRFTQSTTRLLDTITMQIGMAVDNAQLYERALHLAFTDNLTGLYNRRYLLDQLDRDFARANRNGSPLSLVMMDLDGLKVINDRFGHNEGDVVLKKLGRILKQNTRASDIAARWGGDEFVLLAPDTDSKGTYIIGERIRSQLEHCRLKLVGEEISISVSVGIASYPLHSSGVTELIKRADEAMYNAKGLGKNQVCIFSNSNNQTEHSSVPKGDRRNLVKSTA
jgi:diguanylate cyclase (GGDEF)-like protein/PAS domain S-box-containing protein